VNRVLGKTGNTAADFVSATFDDDRIRVPPDLCKIAQLTGDDPIACWLVAASAGRYRLIPQPIAGSADAESLTRLLQEWEEAANSGEMLDGIDSDERAAIRARVIATEALPTRSGWRIKVPMEVRKLVPPGEHDSFVFLLLVSGFIELWFPDSLRSALSTPLTKIMP